MSEATFDARESPLRERMTQWERCNRDHWVDVQCLVGPRSGFWASFASQDFGDVKISEMGMAPHAVQRQGPDPGGAEPDSVLVSLFLEGSGYFHSDEGLITYRPGDAVVYRSRSRFVFGMETDMRQVVLQLPCDSVDELTAPVHIDAVHGGLAGAAELVRDAAAVLSTAAGAAEPGRQRDLVERVQDLVLSSRSDSFRVWSRACRFIECHSHEFLLCQAAVASPVAVAVWSVVRWWKTVRARRRLRQRRASRLDMPSDFFFS